jgi:hypothetical protein
VVVNHEYPYGGHRSPTGSRARTTVPPRGSHSTSR